MFLNGKQELLFKSKLLADQCPASICFHGTEQEILTPTTGDNLLIVSPKSIFQSFLEIKRPLTGFQLKFDEEYKLGE